MNVWLCEYKGSCCWKSGGMFLQHRLDTGLVWLIFRLIGGQPPLNPPSTCQPSLSFLTHSISVFLPLRDSSPRFSQVDSPCRSHIISLFCKTVFVLPSVTRPSVLFHLYTFYCCTAALSVFNLWHSCFLPSLNAKLWLFLMSSVCFSEWSIYCRNSVCMRVSVIDDDGCCDVKWSNK